MPARSWRPAVPPARRSRAGPTCPRRCAAGDREHRPARRGERRGAGPAGHPRDRQADRRGARRGAGDHRHVRLLPRRGPPALRPDRAQRDARQAAVHVPQPGRRGGDHHRGQLPGRRAVVVPGAGAALRQHGGVEAGRVRRRERARALRAVRPRRAARRRAATRATPTAPATFDGLAGALDAGLVDKVGFTGSTAVGAEIGELCGRHLQSPCLELGGKNPMVVTPDADLDLAVEGALFAGFGTAGQRCTSLGTVIVHESRARRVPGPLRRRGRGGAGRRPDRRRADGPAARRAVRRPVRGVSGLDRGRTTRCSGSTGTGRITADQPRNGFVGDPATGCTTTR